MRRNLWLGLVGVLVLAGCEKPKVESTETPATEAPAEATPVVQEAPKNLPPESAPSAPKVDDEVYLVRRFSVPIDGGMRGFREGAKVTVVAVEGGKLTVKGNDVQFDVQAVDISVTPPVAPTPRPAAAGSAAGGAPNSAAASSDLEKKKEFNRITAQISNLQMATNNANAAINQTEAKINQLQTAIQKSGGRGSSPEARARSAEMDRLMTLQREQRSELYRLKKETYKMNTELSRLK